MPTQSLESILYRELTHVAAKDRIAIASPLLQELVNYATNVFARCLDSASGEENEDVASLMLYLHTIEMTDGIEVLISESCPIPAIPLLRSSFEAVLQIEYILEEDYTRRSLSWLADNVRQRLASYEALDPSTTRGKAYKTVLNTDIVAKYLQSPDPALAKEAAVNLQNLLARPQFKVIEAEFERCKKADKRRPAWHRLFNGPATLEGLSRQMRRGAQYEILYRQWSRIAHAQDVSRFITSTKGGESAIMPLRDPDQIEFVTQTAATLMLAATRVVMKKFRPGENVAKWYITEIRDPFLSLNLPG